MSTSRQSASLVCPIKTRRSFFFRSRRRSQTTVEITKTDDHLTICVADEGRGFDPDGMEEQTHEGGFGLTAAREQIELFDGRLEIDSAPDKGTRVIVHAPWIQSS